MTHAPTPPATITTPSPAPSPVHSPTHMATAPAFTLPDQHGADQSLAALLTHRPALLVFYPFAFSSICGGELQELKAALPDLEAQNITLLAISCDPMFSLRVYTEREGFGFPLLSDFWPHGAVAREYGVFDEARGCARRGSFLIDQDAAVRWSVVNPISEARPLDAYLDAIAQLKR